MKAVVVILFGIAVVRAFTLFSQETLFAKFKRDYNKRYGCPEEEEVRFLIFKNTLRKIKAHNKLYKEGRSTYKYAINNYADMMKNEVVTGLNISKPVTEKFSQFMATYNKTYECPELEQLRLKIFELNLKKIKKHNKLYKEGKTTYTEAINKFADLLDDE